MISGYGARGQGSVCHLVDVVTQANGSFARDFEGVLSMSFISLSSLFDLDIAVKLFGTHFLSCHLVDVVTELL